MHIRLIDGTLFGHATACPGDEHRGVVVDALNAFLRQVRQWRKSEPDTLHVVVWDTPADWRRSQSPDYKTAGRWSALQASNDDCSPVLQPWLERFLRLTPMAQIHHPTMEAGDLAYALSRELSAQGHLVTVSSDDKGWIQCIKSRVSWSSSKRYDKVIDEYSFRKDTATATPRAFADTLALVGNPLFGLAPCVGMNEARAKELILEFGSLAAFWTASQDPFFQAPKHFMPITLATVRTQAELNKRLLDFSLAPRPDAGLAVLEFGVFTDIELYEALVDACLTAHTESFGPLTHPFEAPLTREQTTLLKRAVGNMAKAYGAG